MLFARPRNRRSTRPRRPRPLSTAVEGLEVRTLLNSSGAVIRWTMVPQIAPDPAHGNQPDLPNTSSYVNPSGGYPLTLDASKSVGIVPNTTFEWRVTVPGKPKDTVALLSGEDPSLSLPQGKYTVSLRATGLAGSSKVVAALETIQVKDVLIVSIGDSYASGEGNPVVPGVFTLQAPQWAYSPDPAMDLENANAHRSTISGPAQFALQLQEANPHEAVTFVSVANSGASISQGLLGPMTSIGDPTVTLPAEIAEVRQIIGNRRIDALTLSAGGNDIGFSTQLQSLIQNTATGSPTLAALQSQFTAALKTLPGLYDKLGKAIKGLDASKVLVTDYPDLTRNQQGAVAAIPGPIGGTLINQAGAQFASTKVIAPLDEAVASAARANRWSFVDLIPAFSTHGYPSTATYIRQVGESLQMEGNLEGSFHPNAAGQSAIAAQLLAAYKGKKSR